MTLRGTMNGEWVQIYALLNNANGEGLKAMGSEDRKKIESLLYHWHQLAQRASSSENERLSR